jgi:hypothetical protein
VQHVPVTPSVIPTFVIQWVCKFLLFGWLVSSSWWRGYRDCLVVVDDMDAERDGGSIYIYSLNI